MEGKYEESGHAIYMFLIEVYESLNMSLRLSQVEYRNLEIQKSENRNASTCPARLRHPERNTMDPGDARLTSINYTSDTSDTWTSSPLDLVKRATH